MYRYLFIKKVPVILYAILAPASALCSVVTAAAMAAAVDYGTRGELDQIWIYALFFGPTSCWISWWIRRPGWSATGWWSRS